MRAVGNTLTFRGLFSSVAYVRSLPLRLELKHCYQRLHEKTRVPAATPGKSSFRGRAAFLLAELSLL